MDYLHSGACIVLSSMGRALLQAKGSTTLLGYLLCNINHGIWSYSAIQFFAYDSHALMLNYRL